MCVTNRVDTVTPVVSEDEGHQQLAQQQQQQQQQHKHQLLPNDNNDLLQSYLNNLSCAETPPSNHKYKCLAKKSRSHEKHKEPSSSSRAPEQVNESTNQTLEEGKFFQITFNNCQISHLSFIVLLWHLQAKDSMTNSNPNPPVAGTNC